MKDWPIVRADKEFHERTSAFQINHQSDATIFQFIILMFIYSSTCFGRFPARCQELSDCSSSVRGRASWPDHEHNMTVSTMRR